jgi:hypothetical protein
MALKTERVARSFNGLRRSTLLAVPADKVRLLFPVTEELKVIAPPVGDPLVLFTTTPPVKVVAEL